MLGYAVSACDRCTLTLGVCGHGRRAGEYCRDAKVVEEGKQV